MLSCDVAADVLAAVVLLCSNGACNSREESCSGWSSDLSKTLFSSHAAVRTDQ